MFNISVRVSGLIKRRDLFENLVDGKTLLIWPDM